MHTGEVGIEIAPLLDAASVDAKLEEQIDALGEPAGLRAL